MILVAIGTKAQYIKVAPVIQRLRELGVHHRVLLTGQHSETFDELREAFGLPASDDNLLPDFEASTHVRFARWALVATRAGFSRARRALWRQASVVVVHGDTASTLLAAVIARAHGAPVAHLEAGLRSFQWFHPFPEEIVRVAVSRLSALHLCPDAAACANLAHLAQRSRVIDTQGNTLKDALRTGLARLGASVEPSDYAVVSMHRNENLSNAERFDFLMNTVVDTAARIRTLFVLHPATRARLERSGWMTRLRDVGNLELRARTDYFGFVALLARARFLMTDGGSNQEEAAMMGLPCLLLRLATERPDGLGDNVVLSRLDPATIREFVARHVASSWSPRLLEAGSPSANVVDALVAFAREHPRR